MTKRTIILLTLSLLILGCKQSIAQPALPYYDWDAGPCEYCLYGDWTATKNTLLFRRMSFRSSVAFVASEKEKVTAVTGVVITTQSGIGKALEGTFLRKHNKATDTYSDVKIGRGEMFHILTYHGEGVYTVWFRGQLLEASMDLRELLTIRKPTFVWWVKIRNKKGQIGWTRMTRNFNGPHEV